MRRAGTEKTKSAPSALRSALVLLSSIFLLGFLSHSLARPAKLYINNHKFLVVIADSASERQRGLSGRRHLGANHGMLFVFQDENKHCFWMKNMEFPLDIIWADSNKKVVFVENNVSPDSYPAIFCPNQPARYVLEVKSGTAEAIGLNPGSELFW